MIYILYSFHMYNYEPEIKVDNCKTKSFTKGYFIFDTKKEKNNFYLLGSSIISIRSEMFTVREHLVFNNDIKGEIIFLKLKIKEMKENEFHLFFPTIFNEHVTRFNILKEQYPEYVI